MADDAKRQSPVRPPAVETTADWPISVWTAAGEENASIARYDPADRNTNSHEFARDTFLWDLVEGAQLRRLTQRATRDEIATRERLLFRLMVTTACLAPILIA